MPCPDARAELIELSNLEGWSPEAELAPIPDSRYVKQLTLTPRPLRVSAPTLGNTTRNTRHQQHLISRTHQRVPKGPGRGERSAKPAPRGDADPHRIGCAERGVAEDPRIATLYD